MKTKPVKLILMGGALLFAGLFASCSTDDPAVVIDTTDLTAGITSATTLISTTTEGTAEGQFPNGSQAILQTAIDAAQDVLDDATSTQAEVTNATVALAAAVTTYEASVVEAIDPTNLVGQWTFDEITAATVGAVVKDYSGNSHDGAIKQGSAHWGAGTPTLAEDRYGNAGKALHFNEGGNVEIPYNTALNPANSSISLWLKQDEQGTIYADQYMVSMNRWNGYKFQMQSSPKAFYTVKADVVGSVDPAYYDRDNASPILTQGTWWHVVVTFGDGHMVFYLNGVLVKDWDNTPGTGISISGVPVNLVFGQDLPTSIYVDSPDSSPYYVNYGGFFVGTLDEIRIYKSALSASQVTSIYNIEKP